MPAQSLLQLFAIESAIEAATREILAEAGLHDTYLTQATATLPDSYIEITAMLGAATNQGVRLVHDVEVLDYDFFEASLVLRIVTRRGGDQPVLLPGVASLHEAWAAGVRVALREASHPYTEARLPWHAVKTIRPLPTTRDLDPDFMLDFTRLEFRLDVGIRSQSWPS